jgi:hypothetical protein
MAAKSAGKLRQWFLRAFILGLTIAGVTVPAAPISFPDDTALAASEP